MTILATLVEWKNKLRVRFVVKTTFQNPGFKVFFLADLVTNTQHGG